MAPLNLMANKRVVVFCLFVAFGGFLFGYDIGVLAGLLIQPDFIMRFGEDDGTGTYFLSANRQSIITSLLSAGTFFGALSQAFTSDRFGRKGSIFIWSAIFTVGVAIQTGSECSLVQITVGRFVAGLGVGAMSAIVPLYNGEAAPKALRGFLLVFYQVQIITGIFISYILVYAVHKVPGSAAWRVPVGLQLLFGLILCGGILFLPESPRLLLGKGREEEARKAISLLNNCSIDDPTVQEEIDDLNYGLAEENEGGKATWLECFSTRNVLWKRTLNGIMLQFIQQLNGQNFYYYYGPTFFKNSGTELDSYQIQLILGAVSLIATFPSLWLIDRMGRRKMLLWGAVLEASCALIAGLAGHFTAADPGAALTSKNRAGGGVLIAFAVLHIMLFSLLWGPTPWVYLGESFPLRVRPKAIALGTASNWFWNFMLSYFSPKIAAQIGPLILLVFTGVLIFGTFYVYFMVPETKGLSLEEVDAMWQSGVKPWNSTKWVPPAHLSEETIKNEKGEVVHVEKKKRAPVMFH
ncbi:general substrate transporter [Phaffia rhodozyma]|uniref:General substrate transporter n=1 Tax=Phaffia rhodozyma TaxID=264483 RepID=A0A0F7SJM4_PHARH|nr:general substrate transporter [Phaffia rhodozyma]